MAITEHDLGPVRGDINDSVATFTQASARENINSGETGKTIFGKIKKHFADMTLSAFATIVNNATTTVANTVLDGRMGKILMDEILALNRNIEPRTITQKGSFNTLVVAVSGKVACLDAVVNIASSLTTSSTDLIQVNDVTIRPYSGCPLAFYEKTSRTFYQAYISPDGMIKILSPIPAGNYMLSGSWIIK